jgi:hypothetical protein
MKKLIAVASLGLALALPSLSFASDYMELYTKPLAKSNVESDVKGGYIEKDFISFYTSPKNAKPSPSFSDQRETEERDSYIVFGVEVPVRTRS